MRKKIWAKRVAKEVLRDPITVFFGVLFPIVLFILLSFINKSIPAEAQMVLFEPHNLAPGVSVFGLSFISLFSGLLLAKDRTTSFLTRLFTTPITSSDLIFGYTVPYLPLSLAEGAMVYLTAVICGLPLSLGTVLAWLMLLPVSVIFISIGLICGAVFNDKQVGSICGALLTNLSAWLAGIWFDVSLVGEWFEAVSSVFPFIHAVRLCRAALSLDLSNAVWDLVIIVGYAAVLYAVAVILLRRVSKKD